MTALSEKEKERLSGEKPPLYKKHMQRSSGLHLNKPQNLFLGIMHSTVFGDNQNTQHNSTNMSDQCAVRFVATIFFLKCRSSS